MHQLLGLFNHYDLMHPLWAGESEFTKDCEMFCVSLDRYDQAVSLEDIFPDAILCDTFLIPSDMIKAYPTIFFLTEESYREMRDAGGNQQEYLDKLKTAHSVVCTSKALASAVKMECGVECGVQYPCVIDQAPADPKYIYHDPNFRWASKIQAALPREQFRCLSGLNDLGTAKLYLATPPEDAYWSLPLAVAAHRLIPVIATQHGRLEEFLENAGTVLRPDSDFEEWLLAVRACLRDRNYFLDKLKPARVKYRDMREINQRIRDAIRDRPPKPSSHLSPDSRQIINQRRRRTPVVPAHYQQPSFGLRDTIFVTGGIGDILAIESYFSDEQRVLLHTILYATHKQPAIQELFDALPNYPHLKNHKVVWSDFSQFWCFLYKDEVISRLGTNTPQELREAEDWGIVPKFPILGSGIIKYNGSSFLRFQVADVSKFQLPQNYVIVQPYSSDKRIGYRDFNDADWAATIYWLRKRNIKGVVINKGDEPVPADESIINLSNQTSVLEAVEILKGGRGYIGIDSWLTVLATKVFENDWLAIKSVNGHCYNNKHIYFAPKKTFDFIASDIVKALKF